MKPKATIWISELYWPAGLGLYGAWAADSRLLLAGAAGAGARLLLRLTLAARRRLKALADAWQFFGVMPVLILCLGGLSGCSVAREEMRLTYDPKAIVVGSPRAAIEHELGSPDKTETMSDGAVRSVYSTGRVMPDQKRLMIETNILWDMFTFSLYEILDPCGLFDDGGSRIYDVTYDLNDVATQIRLKYVSYPHNLGTSRLL